MKKVLFLLSSVLFFASCEGPMGPQGPQGIPGRDGINGGGAFTYIYDIPVDEPNWKYDMDGGYYYYVENFEFIDQYIYDFASIRVDMDYGRQQTPLPIVRHHKDGNYEWTTTTDYEYGVGEITFYVTSSDYSRERPGNSLFRVSIVWEENYD